MVNNQAQPRTVVEPEFIRLPRTGELCPYTGLTRSFLNSLILPTDENKQSPPVVSYVRRKKGARTGVRLIEYKSLTAHIREEFKRDGAPVKEAA